jgi:hypothetical protein
MIHALARLRRLVERLPHLGEDGAQHAAALERFLGGQDFEEVLGLAAGWRAVERRSRRDTLIRELAGHYPGSRYARAETIGAELRRYQATAWRYDRRHAALSDAAPVRKQLMHKILTVDPAAPTSTRRLHDILQSARVAIAEASADIEPAPEHEGDDESRFAA